MFRREAQKELDSAYAVAAQAVKRKHEKALEQALSGFEELRRGVGESLPRRKGARNVLAATEAAARAQVEELAIAHLRVGQRDAEKIAEVIEERFLQSSFGAPPGLPLMQGDDPALKRDSLAHQKEYAVALDRLQMDLPHIVRASRAKSDVSLAATLTRAWHNHPVFVIAIAALAVVGAAQLTRGVVGWLVGG